MNTDSFEKVCNEIRARYIEAGHKDDVRFLTCSNRAFRDEVPVLILDKRPGKNTLGIAYDEYSCERGNAYFAERWSKNKAAGQTSLQLRMQAFYEDLRKFMGVDMTAETFAQEHVLTAYFNPFRDDCEEDETFLEGLWKSVLGCLNPNMIFALAKEPFSMLEKYFSSEGRSWKKLGEIKEVQERFDYKMFLFKGIDRDREVLVVALPSFSKYRYSDKGGAQEEANKKLWEMIGTFL